MFSLLTDKLKRKISSSYIILSVSLFLLSSATVNHSPLGGIYPENISRRTKIPVIPVVANLPTEVVLPDGSVVLLPDNFDPNQPLKVALVALDKDSTLTNAREPISDESAEKVIALLEKGIKVLILTGSDAANTMDCVSKPIMQRIFAYGKDVSIMQNLIISSSAGGFNFTFDRSGNFNELQSLATLNKQERFAIRRGMMYGFSAAIERYKRELGIKDVDIVELNAAIKRADAVFAGGGLLVDGTYIAMLNDTFVNFARKYPQVFGDVDNLPAEERVCIRDEDLFSYPAPKITFEVAHLPDAAKSIIQTKEFTDIVKRVASEYIIGIEGLHIKNGPTYVDFARSMSKSEVVEMVIADERLGIGEGAVIVAGDSSNDVDMITMNLAGRTVFRYYVGVQAKFGEYLNGMPADKVAQVIHCPTEAGPAEISTMFSYVLDALGKPMGEFRFIQNGYSYIQLIGLFPN